MKYEEDFKKTFNITYDELPTKVIFLDYNGVIDTRAHMDEINSENVTRLKYIVNETNAVIVISSSLRYPYFSYGSFSRMFYHMTTELLASGLPIISMLPCVNNNRELEIKTYLDTHPTITDFCILDDDYDMVSFKEHMVKLVPQIDPSSTGLDEEHMYIAIDILNKRNLKKI